VKKKNQGAGGQPAPWFLFKGCPSERNAQTQFDPATPRVRLAGISSELITPKVSGLLMFSDGSKKFTWLNRLKKSVEIFETLVERRRFPQPRIQIPQGEAANGMS